MKTPGSSEGSNERDSVRYANAAAKVIGVLGEVPRARIARALIGLETSLDGIMTLATLRDALEFCMRNPRRAGPPRPA